MFINTTVATILEQNKSGTSNGKTYIRGVNLAGAEFSDRGPNGSLDLSVPGAGYYYPDDQGTFTFLKSRGVDLVRFPIRWERWQRTLKGALDNSELAMMDAMMTLAQNAGVKVLIDMHNYGRYDTTPTGANTNGVLNLGQNTNNGTGSMISAFADFWTKVAQRYKDHPALWGYGLCNEPYGLDGGVNTWQEASRQVTEAIRLVDQNHIIAVGGYFYSTVPGWLEQNGPTAWLTETIPAGQTGAGQPRNTDPLIRFEGHHYWDINFNGGFEDIYDTELQNAQNQGFSAYSTPGYTAPTTGTGWPNGPKTDYRQVYVTHFDSPSEFQPITPADNIVTLPDAGAGIGGTNGMTIVGSATSNAASANKDISGTGGARRLNFNVKIPTGQTLPTAQFPHKLLHLWNINYQADLLEVGFYGNGTQMVFALMNPATGTVYSDNVAGKRYNAGAFHKLTVELTDTAFNLYVDGKTTPDVTFAANNTNQKIGAFAAGKFYSTSYTGPIIYDELDAGLQATYDAPADSPRADQAPTPTVPTPPGGGGGGTGNKAVGILINFGA